MDKRGKFWCLRLSADSPLNTHEKTLIQLARGALRAVRLPASFATLAPHGGVDLRTGRANRVYMYFQSRGCEQPTSSDLTLRIYVERNHRY
jgi:hypothetical protein